MRDGRTKVPKAREALVPKPNGLMRPAHQLTLESRLYFQAMVDAFMYDLDKRLAGKNHVFGYRPLAPRSTDSPFGLGLGQWKRFRDQLRREVSTGAYGAMVRTDLAAFFELIPHGPLEERLTSLGVRADLASELRSYLKSTMGRAHGLPQGPDPSGVLASAYLHPLDRAIVDAGYGYVRYVDDIIVLADDLTDAKKALRLLEVEARRLNLLIQSAKTEMVVGATAMLAAVSDDDEIAGINYVVTSKPKVVAISVLRRAWHKAKRQTPLQKRLIKYLLGRLTDRRDPVAVAWCLDRLGELDYIAPTVGRYLAVFSGQPKLQRRIVAFLNSHANISEWEEMNLSRALLSAKKVDRSVLARARVVAADLNLGIEVRQYALLNLGKHGDGSDHDFVARLAISDELLAQVAVLALHGADPKTRGKFFADVVTRYPTNCRVVDKVKGLASPRWPLFRA